jgi:predicted phage tail protein
MMGSIVAGAVSMATTSVLSSAVGINDDDSTSSTSSSVDSLSKGILLNTAGTVDPIMVVYGRRKIGGTRVLTEASGASNEYLHIVIAHCEGPIDAIETVYLDDIATTDAKFAGLVTVETFLGHDDQVACQSLIDALPGKWTAAHRLCGVAYTYVRLKYDSNVFSSLPTITVDIRGRTVYDPRTGATAWSENPALCVRDYLINARYGRGNAASGIDDAMFIIAANDCELTFTAPDGTTHQRHTCNGVINTDMSSSANMVNLLSCCRGMLIFSARGYGLLVDKAQLPSDFEFNEDNIAGSWTFSPGGKRTRFNRVRGNWFNPLNSWQQDIIVADSTPFRAEDNGLMLEAQVELPFTTNSYESQVLTERHLRQSRFGMTATFRAFVAGMFCEVGDVVPITHSTPGWSAKSFRIVRISLLSSDEVEVEVAEYDDAVYSATPLTTPRRSMTTNLPDPSNIPAPINLVLAMSTQDQPNGSSVPRFTATWTAPLSMWVVGYDVAWREDDSPWDTTFVTETKFTLLATAVGRLYEVRVRAVGSLGKKSVWVSASGTQPVPTTLPAAPLAHAVGGLFCVRLTWTFGDTRQDIRATEIWFCSENDRGSATRLSSEPFPGREYTHPGLAPGAGGYYWLCVVDTWGNTSADSGALYAVASTDPSDLLTQLQGALGMPQLAAELAAPIAQIGGMATDIIQRALDIDALSERALFQRAVNSATVDVDPVTGKITSLATAAVTTDVEARLTQAEVDINAAEGSINNAVATLETVENDLSSAQSQIAQLANSIALGVSDVQISQIAGQVSGAITVDSAAASQALAETALRQAIGLDHATDKELATRARVAVAEFDLAAKSEELQAEAAARLALAAVVTGNAAALTVEQTARANADSAEATARQALAATVGNNTSAIQNEATARANADSSLAQQIGTVQASLSGSIASVQETASAAASAVEGVEAKWGVKTQAMQDGVLAQAGIELLSGTSGQSVIAFLSNKVLYYMPDGTNPRQVLIVGVVNGVTALGFDGSMVIDGSVAARSLVAKSITGDQIASKAIKANSGIIDELAVGTLQLAGNAVTVPVAAEAYGGFPTIAVVLDFPGYVQVTGGGNGLNGGGYGSMYLRIVHTTSGAAKGEMGISLNDGYSGSISTAAMFGPLDAGTHYFSLSGSVPFGVSWGWCYITALGAKK